MSGAIDNRSPDFTYTWTIENASKLQFEVRSPETKRYSSFRSPIFTADSGLMLNTKWQLCITGIEELTIFLRRVENDDGPDMVDIYYSISLLSADGCPLVKMIDRQGFSNSSNYALQRLARSDDVFNIRKDEFLSQGTLTVTCSMWRTDIGALKADRTRLDGDSESLDSQMEEFDSADLDSTAGAPEVEVRDTRNTDSPLDKFIMDCYKKGTLCDIRLRTGSQSFLVHKLVLGAYSPVFESMFTKEAQNTSGCMDIPDVDADTMRRMLSYIYTKVVPELEWESAVDLFAVASKYEIVDLRELCSWFLTTNLSVSNCCSILIVADKYQDDGLLLALQEFMFKNKTEIFRSEEWSAFKSNNFELAMDTLEFIICLMKMQII